MAIMTTFLRLIITKNFFKIENKLSQKIKFNYHKEINHRKYTIFKPTKKLKIKYSY